MNQSHRKLQLATRSLPEPHQPKRCRMCCPTLYPVVHQIAQKSNPNHPSTKLILKKHQKIKMMMNIVISGMKRVQEFKQGPSLFGCLRRFQSRRSQTVARKVTHSHWIKCSMGSKVSGVISTHLYRHRCRLYGLWSNKSKKLFWNRKLNLCNYKKSTSLSRVNETHNDRSLLSLNKWLRMG